MRHPRIIIAGLLGLVAFVAVTFAALRHPTEAWDSGVFGLLLLVLLTSTLLAVHRSGGRRSFWLGFSLFVWAYVGLSLVPPTEARLPTRKGFEQAWELMTGPDFVVADDYLIYTSAPSNASNPTASTSPVITGAPDKWDVVVFPDPGPSTPAKYIKRLVGLPGDSWELRADRSFRPGPGPGHCRGLLVLETLHIKTFET